MADESVGLPYVVRGLAADVTDLKAKNVPRAEHEWHWKRDDERASSLKDAIEKLTGKVDSLVEADIPRRIDRVESTLEEMPGRIFRGVIAVVTLIASVAGIIAWAIAHIH
jgi:hypothetical protein